MGGLRGSGSGSEGRDRDMGNSSFERGLVVTLFHVDMFMPADAKLRQCFLRFCFCFSSARNRLLRYKLDTCPNL